MTNEQKQNLLQFLGLYTGAIDGIWGPKSQEAMEEVRAKYEGSEDEEALLTAVGEWEEDATDNDDGHKTGTFWDEIEFFARNEPGIACPCGRCGGFPVEPVERLMRNADAVRRHFGKPMIPSSTVRCAAHNAELPGSAANSLHMRGKAMDFAIPGVSASTIADYVKTLPEVHECYPIDGSYVHMGVQKH